MFNDPLGFLTYAKCHSVAVALIDIWMPAVSGLQVKKELQAISPKTRVIIITANDDDSARNQAMQDGTIALFIKPFADGARTCSYDDVALCGLAGDFLDQIVKTGAD